MTMSALFTPRNVLGAASVVIVALVVFTALPFVPPNAGGWLLVSGVLAVIAAVQTAASDPRDLKTALLLALPPVIALVADDSPTWLIAPLGVLLLVAAELNTLSWECLDAMRLTAVQRRRLRTLAGLAGLGFLAALTVAVVVPGLPAAGAVPMLLAAAAVAGLGLLLFRRTA